MAQYRTCSTGLENLSKHGEQILVSSGPIDTSTTPGFWLQTGQRLTARTFGCTAGALAGAEGRGSRPATNGGFIFIFFILFPTPREEVACREREVPQGVQEVKPRGVWCSDRDGMLRLRLPSELWRLGLRLLRLLTLKSLTLVQRGTRIVGVHEPVSLPDAAPPVNVRSRGTSSSAR